MVPPMSCVAGLFGHRHRFAGHHRFVQRRMPLDHRAVDRHLFAGAHAQPVADHDRLERDLLFGSVVRDAPRRLRREVEERADGAGGLLARPQFQHLAEQHQHGDHRGGLEIDRDRAVFGAERRRKDAGRDSGDDAVDPGDAGAERDQREHVEVAGDQRLPAALEERPARPQHDRRGEHQLHPVRSPAARSACAGRRRARPSPERRPVRASATPTQKRRVMSRSSGLGPLSAVTITGSSAMPQIGQAPGPTCRISGCIGQV